MTQIEDIFNDMIAINPEAVAVDGFDDCIIGIGESFGRDTVFIYDKIKVIQQLMEDGMSQEEAIEFFDFNILGAYVGEAMPMFATLYENGE